MILLITDMELVVERLSQILTDRGAPHRVISEERVTAGEVGLSFEIAKGETRMILRAGEGDIDLASVRAVWFFRKPYAYHPAKHPIPSHQVELSQAQRYFFVNEWSRLIGGILNFFAARGVPIVNPPGARQLNEEKMFELVAAREAGLSVPETCLTTRIEEAEAFCRARGFRAVIKSLGGYFEKVDKAPGDGKAPYKTRKILTSRVTEASFSGDRAFLPAPILVQEIIEKKTEIRATIVGDQVFVAELHSHESDKARMDWRRDAYGFRYTPYDLPLPVQQRLRAVMKRLGLTYGTMDLIVTPDDDFVFLEVNPQGHFDWIAKLAGLPIYEAVADLLMALSGAAARARAA